MPDPLLVFTATIAFVIAGVGYTCRMAMLERAGQLAARGSIRRRRRG
ncbi:hypothetical protein [Sphingomonas koreensis]